MKYFDKFYEIGNNKYYTIMADNDMYLASESFIRTKKGIFKRFEDITTGFKLLKLSVPMVMLLNEITGLKKCKKQKYRGYDDMVLYEPIVNKDLKNKINDKYEEARIGEITYLEEMIGTLTDEKQIEFYKNEIEKLKKLDMLKEISLRDISKTSCNTIKTMLREGFEHLYTEKINSFSNNEFLYELDCFGTVTIYRIQTVKNVVKSIDSFIYDKKLIDTLLKVMYEEGR